MNIKEDTKKRQKNKEEEEEEEEEAPFACERSRSKNIQQLALLE